MRRLKLAHVTRIPLSRSKGQRSRSPVRFTHRGVNASGSCSGERGNVLAVGIYCYVEVCTLQARSARRREAPIEGGEGRGHIVAAARLQLVYAESAVKRQPTNLISRRTPYYAPAPNRRGIKRWCCLTSDVWRLVSVCLSVCLTSVYRVHRA